MPWSDSSSYDDHIRNLMWRGSSKNHTLVYTRHCVAYDFLYTENKYVTGCDNLTLWGQAKMHLPIYLQQQF